jgi:hypothetical protein
LFFSALQTLMPRRANQISALERCMTKKKGAIAKMVEKVEVMIGMKPKPAAKKKAAKKRPAKKVAPGAKKRTARRAKR